MSSLEESVKHLADALDALETNLDERLQDLAHHSDAVDAARRQARTARAQTAAAADGVATAIRELRAILKDDADVKDERHGSG